MYGIMYLMNEILKENIIMDQVTYMAGIKMTLTRRGILEVLNVVKPETDEDKMIKTILLVEQEMDDSGIDYSECTQREFDNECCEAIDELNLEGANTLRCYKLITK
jgi:hypothetical protein